MARKANATVTLNRFVAFEGFNLAMALYGKAGQRYITQGRTESDYAALVKAENNVKSAIAELAAAYAVDMYGPNEEEATQQVGG